MKLFRFLPKNSVRLFSTEVNKYSLRSHNCGALRLADVGKRVELYGWLYFNRMNKFLVLKDSYGLTQLIVPNEGSSNLERIISGAPVHSVLKVSGVVADRGANRNSKMETGDVEVVLDSVEVLNKVEVDVPLKTKADATEKTRLTYRFLDLRSELMQKNLRFRSKVVHNMRNVLTEKLNFVDVETPTLAQLTPGGAKEFPVPCGDPHKGRFYSLPQSPQIFKQLLMCGGIDRYFQIARCYRDEGGKADRQPEFTQLDLEMSFTSQENVMKLVEQIIVDSWPDALSELRPTAPFQHLPYSDAMNLYGTDKPDLRIPWQIFDCTDDFSQVHPFNDENNTICAFIARGVAAKVTGGVKKRLKDELKAIHFAERFDILKLSQKNALIEKSASVIERYNITAEDAIVVSWGTKRENVLKTLGSLRNRLGEIEGLRSQAGLQFLWVVDFPLFIDVDDGLESAHHPFTAPSHECEKNVWEQENLTAVKALHYDLVMNGVELGGGSIRIHDARLQRHVLENILKLPTSSLGKFISALEMGAPPHGGFALGLDRYLALLLEHGDYRACIRDVIAFPKTSTGRCLMMGCPDVLPSSVLERYSLAVTENANAKETVATAVADV